MAIDWHRAGLDQGVDGNQKVVNIHSFNPKNTDATSALISAIQSLKGDKGVVFIPSGRYIITSMISLPSNVIIRGAGSDSTELVFVPQNGDDHCFSISAPQSASFSSVGASLKKGSSAIKASVLPDARTGDYLEIREKNDSWDVVPASWAKYCVGQIVKVVKVADSIYFDQPLRIKYDSFLNPEARKVNLVSNVGIEALKITRADSLNTGSGNNILFNYAANCWVKGVESVKSRGAHVLADACSHLLVTGCYFHEAYLYDGVNTNGYGVTLVDHTGDCLVENNVFSTLRHAMMVKQGANGNVFGYNYSTHVVRTEFPNNGSGDISLHGHFPFANLFEGNIVQNINLDMTWGPAGPYNCFFRNRTELYGLIMADPNGAPLSNELFIGNEITGKDALYGNYLLTGKDNYAYGNNVKGAYKPSPISDIDTLSFYLADKPNFWTVHNGWPSLSLPSQPGSGTIPAQARYLSQSLKTVYYNSPIAAFSNTTDCPAQTSSFTNKTTIADGSVKTYLWTFGDGDSSSEASPSHTYLKADNYLVTLKAVSSDGLTDTAAHIINILPAPAATTKITTSDSITFRFDAGKQVNGLSYQWDFNDGLTAVGPAVTHRFETKGLHDIALTVTNNVCNNLYNFEVQSKDSVVKTGINATDNYKRPFQVYPNPASGYLTIQFGQVGKNYTISLITLQGSELLRMQTSATELTLPLNCKPGVYILRLTLGENAWSQEVVKLR